MISFVSSTRCSKSKQSCRATVRAMANILETHRSYIGPPGMDAQAVSAFRAAATAALKDPELVEESKKGERPVAPGPFAAVTVKGAPGLTVDAETVMDGTGWVAV